MTVLYCLIQWTWGLPQNLLGLLLFFLHRKDPHDRYHGAVVTVWSAKSSVSIGMFVFITDAPYFYEKLQAQHSREELSQRLLVHEYGHTIQSLLLGPLYLLIMGIPSTLWGFLPSFNRKRREKKISYFSFFTERWANCLGEAVTKQASMEQLLID